MFQNFIEEGVTIVPNRFFSSLTNLSLSNDQFVIVIYLMFQLGQGNSLIDFDQIAQDINWQLPDVLNCFNELIEKNIISIDLKENSDGKQSDHFSLEPMFTQLFEKSTQSNEINLPEKINTDVYQAIEQEFGRPLSSIELEIIQNWIYQDKYDRELILLALREAVIHQAYSLNYIDTILLNWQKKNIRTATEAEQAIKRFQNRHNTSNQALSADYSDMNVPLFNWQKKESSP